MEMRIFVGVNVSRRAVLAGCGLIAAQFCVGGAVSAFAGQASVLRPPSMQDEAAAFAACLKCGRCQSACPQGCLRTGVLEDGVLNWRMPIMDFHRGACDFCGKCAQVCPSQAISNASDPACVIGVAVIDPARCIAWAAGSACLACVDACPYGAIWLDESGRPVIDTQACNGCGACEFACPSNSYRSFAGGTARGVNVEVL